MFEPLEAIARRAGALALHYAEGRDFAVEAKGPLDLVTIADRAVEAQLVQDLQEAFPQDGILGEEGTAIRPEAARQWIIDPIDGTFNFVRGLPDWAISIGLVENGLPRFGAIFAPLRNRLLIGGRDEGTLLNGSALPKAAAFDPAVGVISLGIASNTPVAHQTAVLGRILGDLGISMRNCGSTAVALMQVAEGQVDAMLGIGNKAWDVAGGIGASLGLGYASTVDFTAQSHGAPISFMVGKPEVVAKAAMLLAPPSP